MEHTALRPYAAGCAALLGAALIAVIPAVAPSIPHIQAQSPEVALASTADAFLDLANALDPSASTDGLIGVATNLDSFLDLFGTPTVNVVDTLTSDFIADVGIGSEVGTIDGDLNAGFALLDSDFGTLETALTTGLSSLGSDLSLGSISTALGQIDSDIVGVDSDLDLGFRNLFEALTNDLSPLSTIATELGNTGVLAGDLSSIYEALLALISVS
jgi:hypothetical protein